MTDISYLRTGEVWLYLVVIIDLQYTGYKYQQFLNDQHIISSMSVVASYHDNSATERFTERLNVKRLIDDTMIQIP